MSGYRWPMVHKLITERLVLRGWDASDAGASSGSRNTGCVPGT
jgi:hypothetical protein